MRWDEVWVGCAWGEGVWHESRVLRVLAAGGCVNWGGLGGSAPVGI